MSTVRKLLLAVLLVSLTGSAFGAGTFASFNASTTNGSSTFATGTIVLSNKTTDKNNAVNTCLSTVANGTNTDVNANSTGCGTLFNVTLGKPGDTATIDLDLFNDGSLTATSLKAHASAACTDALNTTSNPGNYTGSGNLCSWAQFRLQEYSDANRTVPSVCWWGTGASAIITSSALTFPKVITLNTNDKFNLTVDGLAALTDVVIPAATYNTPQALAAAMQTAIRAKAGTPGDDTLVGGDPTAVTLSIASGKMKGTTGIGTSAVTINTPTTAAHTALPTLGFTNAQTNTLGAAATTCTASSAHHFGGFTSNHATAPTGLNFNSQATGAGATRRLRLTLDLPLAAGNEIQGRTFTSTLTWRLDQ